MYVQTLPTEQATSVVTDFFSRGHDPYAPACKARPLTIVGRTSLSVSLSLLPRRCCRLSTRQSENALLMVMHASGGRTRGLFVSGTQEMIRSFFFRCLVEMPKLFRVCVTKSFLSFSLQCLAHWTVKDKEKGNETERGRERKTENPRETPD